MANVNVNRENTDQFYRYKMPSLMAKVEGKGNGIKTVIVNMSEIGKALNRPASYCCKYFGCELGAQTQMDIKNARYIVNGAHEGPRLQDMLDVFIKKFVLCPECDNPETELTVLASKGKIRQTCRACGHLAMIDPRHKLTTFIINHPPNDESGSGKKDKKGRKGASKGKKKDESSTSPQLKDRSSQDVEAGDDDFLDDPPTPVQNGNGTVVDDGAKRGVEEEWSVDTSEAAIKARMEKLSDQASALTLNKDLERPQGERVNMFYTFVEDIKLKGGVAAVAGALTKIKAEAERLDVMDLAAGILAELLYTEKLLTQIKEYRPIMLHFVVDNRKAQKTLLGAFEILVGQEHPELLLPRVPLILKAFYDCDLLEEESILEWAEKVSKKHVKKEVARQIREKAAPFIKWLQEAEEESSDEEDDDIEVVYAHDKTAGSVVKPPPTVEVHDIDIDAI